MPLAPAPVPVFEAGYGPVPADFNTRIQASLGFATAGIFFRAEQHAAQAIPATTFTTITYDTTPEDPYSGWNATSHEWVAPWTGLYEITITTNIVTGAPVPECVLLVTGVTRYEISQGPGNSLGASGCCGTLIVPLVGGTDYVQGQCWMSAAATLDTATPGRYSSMEITLVSQ
jgi:hypothetical protein